jgi:EAL domain-containing protein (putative c-di-GMP-specific phosphodiesterase class I)
VETDTQLALLTQIGCDYIQGYWYSKPLSVDAFEHWLRARMQNPV